MLNQPPHKRTQRASEATGSRTVGNTGRKKLARSKSRSPVGSLRSRPYSPAEISKALRKLGKRIRALRTRKGLTQTQLANRCGISALQLDRIESGQVNLSVTSIARFAQKLHITVAQILRGIP